jgi:hypothetical protein
LRLSVPWLLRLAVARLLRLPVTRLLRLAIAGLAGLPVTRLAWLSVHLLLLRLLGLGIRSTASRYESGSCEDEGCVGENRSFHGGSSGKVAKKGPVFVGLAPHVLFNTDFELLCLWNRNASRPSILAGDASTTPTLFGGARFSRGAKTRAQEKLVRRRQHVKFIGQRCLCMSE